MDIYLAFIFFNINNAAMTILIYSLRGMLYFIYFGIISIKVKIIEYILLYNHTSGIVKF